MLAHQVRDVVHELQNAVWADDLGPSRTTQLSRQVGNMDDREAEIQRVGLAGVDVISGPVKGVIGGILRLVGYLEILEIMGVADTKFVDDGGIGRSEERRVGKEW